MEFPGLVGGMFGQGDRVDAILAFTRERGGFVEGDFGGCFVEADPDGDAAGGAERGSCFRGTGKAQALQGEAGFAEVAVFVGIRAAVILIEAGCAVRAGIDIEDEVGDVRGVDVAEKRKGVSPAYYRFFPFSPIMPSKESAEPPRSTPSRSTPSSSSCSASVLRPEAPCRHALS